MINQDIYEKKYKKLIFPNFQCRDVKSYTVLKVIS